MKRLIFAILCALTIFAAIMIGALAAHAQSACGPLAQLVAMLAEKYGEAPVAVGVSSDGTQEITLFANPTTLTWTLAVTQPTGAICLAAAGGNYKAIAYVAPPKGKGT